MNIFATIEEAIRFDLVTYYTVRLEVGGVKADKSEFEKWIAKHSEDEYIADEYHDIMALLERMGRKLTAKLRYFRNERNADALPPNWLKLTREEKEAHIPYSKNLRLYCIRITERIVILFNGAVKSDGARTAEECQNVRRFFRQANAFAKAIDTALTHNDLQISDSGLIYDDRFELEINL